jgi:hypothetical protein
LSERVSIFGFTVSGAGKPRPLIPLVLESAGLEVRDGFIELLPSHRHTLRLPLAHGTVQLDSLSLEPLPYLPRAQAIKRFVDSLDQLAAAAPLDPWALAARLEHGAAQTLSGHLPRKLNSTAQRARSERSASRRGDQPTGSAALADVDVDRVEREGLYPDVSRNEAARKLASRKMLTQGFDAPTTVSHLMQWTLTSTNGLSNVDLP